MIKKTICIFLGLLVLMMSFSCQDSNKTKHLFITLDSTMGTVTGAGKYMPDTDVTLSATPKDGFAFSGWYKADMILLSKDNPYTFKMTNDDLEINALFEEIKPINLTVVSNNEEIGSVTGTGIYIVDEEVELVATPKSGYIFNGWFDKETSKLISSDNPYTYKIPGNDCTIEGKFSEEVKYSLTVQSNNAKFGSVTGSGSYAFDEEVDLIAVENDYYSFVEWYSVTEDKVLSTSKVYSIIMPNKDLIIEGRFEAGVHDHIEGEWVITKPSTCMTLGDKELRCEICDVVLETAKILMSNHKYEETVIKQNTCLEDGQVRGICVLCGSTYLEDTYRTGHKSTKWEVKTVAMVGGKPGVKVKNCDTCGVFIGEEQYVLNGYSVHGKLSVSGTDLVGEHGRKVQLMGISTHGFNFFPDFVNLETFTNAQLAFGINTMRLAMYTSEKGGYCQANGIYKPKLTELMKNAINYVTDLDMYAIVDWHMVGADEVADKNPLTYVEDSMEFFGEISKTFKDNENILYEICNEPNGDTTWADIVKYANQVIPVIRANDPDAIVIVGNPHWSADLNSVKKAPLTQYDNIMYTFHFYANSHKESARNMVKSAYQAGLPIFITEHGLMSADGNGTVNTEEGMKWYSLLDELNLSFVAWNMSRGPGDASMFKTSTPSISDFSNANLKPWGIWLKNYYRSRVGLDPKE